MAEKFLEAIRRRNLTSSKAAVELGVTRQAFSKYVRGESTPQAAILARACTLWDLRLNYAGVEFSKSAFVTSEPQPTEPELLQANFFDEPQEFENEHLIVVLKRSHKSTLEVTIKMKQASLPPSRETARSVEEAG